MNRTEFMEQLESLLSDIPEYERLDALAYYNDYFDDAGAENEEEIIRKLGSPQKVASIIKTNLEKGQEHGEFTEYGYRETDTEEPIQTPAARGREDGSERRQHSRTYRRNTESRGAWQRAEFDGRSDGDQSADRESGSSTAQEQKWNADSFGGGETYPRRRRGAAGWTLLIILLVFASPLLLGAGGGIIGAFFGILGGLISLVFSILGAGIELFVGGIIGIGKGIFTCFGAPAVGIMTMGLGFLSTGLGMVCLVLFSWALRLIPGVVRWARNMVSRIFHRIQGGMQR